MPFGFAARVLCRNSQSEAIVASAERLWLSLALRTLATVSAVLVIFATLLWGFVSNPQPLRPPIERSIVDCSKLL